MCCVSKVGRDMVIQSGRVGEGSMIAHVYDVENRTRSVPKGITTLERGSDIKADA